MLLQESGKGALPQVPVWMVQIWSPSAMRSSTAETVALTPVDQLAASRVTEAGETAHWPLSATRGTDTAALGWLVSLMVKRAESAGSVTVRLVGLTVMLATSLSRTVTATLAGSRPL